MAKLFLKGTIDVYGMHSSYYLNYVMWQKIWSRGRSWIRKKQWLDRVIWDWEAVPCSFRNLYATLPNVLNKHRIDRNGEGHYLIQSFICSSFRFKEGVERFFFFYKNGLMNIELFGVVQTPLSKLSKVTNYAKCKEFRRVSNN